MNEHILFSLSRLRLCKFKVCAHDISQWATLSQSSLQVAALVHLQQKCGLLILQLDKRECVPFCAVDAGQSLQQIFVLGVPWAGDVSLLNLHPRAGGVCPVDELLPLLP